MPPAAAAYRLWLLTIDADEMRAEQARARSDIMPERPAATPACAADAA